MQVKSIDMVNQVFLLGNSGNSDISVQGKCLTNV